MAEKREVSIKEILDSPSYQQQKQVIANEINSLYAPKGYALPSFAPPSRTHGVDYTTFKKTQKERDEVKAMKLKLGKPGKMTTYFKGTF